MTAQSTIALNTLTYLPYGRTGDIATWALTNDPSFGGATSKLTEVVREGGKQSGLTRVHFKLHVPKAASADSACGCTGEVTSESYMDLVVTVPRNFTAAEREDVRKRIQSLVAAAVFQRAVDFLEPSW